MPEVVDTARPCLAAGCRWSEQAEPGVLLFPEGTLRLQTTAYAILGRCDGQRTISDIVEELRATYGDSDPAKIKHDVVKFLGELHRKRLVDFR
jgi:pyrroloquinoline quinone biosynthesis protein D